MSGCERIPLSVKPAVKFGRFPPDIKGVENVEHIPDGLAGAGPHVMSQARSRLCNLPAFRPVALKMLKVLADEVAEVQELTALLRSDPALSAEVLAVANSAFYGKRQSIDSLARAVLIMGFERTRSLTMTVSLRSLLRHRTKTQHMEACWRHSLASALLAEELAPLYGLPKDQAYTALLIHDSGRLGLLMAYGEWYAPVLGARHANLAGCLASERRLFQMDHCQAGLWLTQQWGFPPIYSRVAGCHHDELPPTTHDLASLAQVSCQLADALGFAAVSLAQAPSTAEIVARLPENPWAPYTFDENGLQTRIAEQIASGEMV